MKRSRFLALVARDRRPLDEPRQRIERSLGRAGDFRCVWAGERAVMCLEGHGIELGPGVIAGTVFERDRTTLASALSMTDAGAVTDSEGQSLIGSHWGGYVALFERAGRVAILRSPLGDLPCLFAAAPDGVAVASDAALLAHAGCRLDVDFPALARHLAAPDLRRSETCLAGVRELQGGMRLNIGHGPDRLEEAWTPWSFAMASRQITDPATACAVLRAAILHTVAALGSVHRKVVLRLSGGLDSSIVAASLAHAGVPTVALNLVTDDVAGDEREYARQVASATGIELVERLRQLAAVDLRVSTAANLPRPSARAFIQASLDHASKLADEAGADALFDGGGGDNVFCSLQSIRPVVDCLRSRRGLTRALDTARSIAALSQVSQIEVLQRALVARARAVSRYSFPLDAGFLSRDAIEAAQGAARHRWLNAPPRALPGKAAHIGLIAAAQSVVESFDPGDPLPIVSPLISQPVVEACAAIPSWLWFARSHNRAIARAAFADLLPPAIAWRRSKGAPDGFIAELYRANRAMVEDWLINGTLMANGLLDRAALGAALGGRGPIYRHDFIRILQLVDAESWVRSRAA